MKPITESRYANICLFPIKSGLKQAGAASAVALQLCCRMLHWRVLASWEALKLNGAQQLLYTDDVIYWVKAYIPEEKHKRFGGGGGKEIGL
jgi:hypothetical protein